MWQCSSGSAIACGDIGCGECTAGAGRLAAALGNGDVTHVLQRVRELLAQQGGDRSEPCVLECTVQQITLHQRHKETPVLGWLTGQKEVLFVEIAPQGARTRDGARRTASGEVAPSRGGDSRSEVWVWGSPMDTNTSTTKFTGEKLVLQATYSMDLSLKVLRGQRGWRGEPPAQLRDCGEARFRVDEDVVPAVILGGILSLPLVSEGRVQGVASVLAQLQAPLSGAAAGAPPPILGPWVQQNRLVRLKVQGSTAAVTCCAPFPGSSGRIITGSADGCSRIWSMAGALLATLKGHTGSITQVAVFPSCDQVLTASEDDTAVIWSLAGKQLVTLGGVRFCSIFPAGDLIFAGGGGANGAVFRAASGEQVASLRGHSDRITGGAVFPGGQRLLTIARDEEAILWTSTGEVIKVMRGHSDAVSACAIFPSGDHVLTGSKDRTGIIWTSSGALRNMARQVAVLRGHTGDIVACAVFPSEEQVLTVSDDERGIIWSVAGDRLAELKGHTDAVSCCAVFSAGDLVFTGSHDKSAMIWSKEGEQVAELNAHSDRINACFVFPSGRYAVTVSSDGTGVIWPMSLYLSASRRR